MKKFICKSCGGIGRALNEDAPWAVLGLCLDCWGQAAENGEIKVINGIRAWSQVRNEVT